MAQVERDDLWQAIYEASPYNWPMPCEHFAHRQQGGWDVCAECETDGIYEAVIKHLTESGRLLPPGGEVSTQYGVRWHATPGYGDEWDDWGFSDEAHAREEMASSPTPSTLLRLRAITLPVEPVVSDTSEAPDG